LWWRRFSFSSLHSPAASVTRGSCTNENHRSTHIQYGYLDTPQWRQRSLCNAHTQYVKYKKPV
jgi:hypothetical protein